MDALFLYDHIVCRLICYDRCSLIRCKAVIYHMIVRWPRLGYWIPGVCYKRFKFINYVGKTKLDDIVAVDHFSGFRALEFECFKLIIPL